MAAKKPVSKKALPKISTKQLDRLERRLLRVQKSSGTFLPLFTPLHDWLRLHSPLYYWWHTKAIASYTHWVLLIVGTIVIACATVSVLVFVSWLELSGVDFFSVSSFLFNWR